MSMTDVRNKNDLSDYTGQLQVNPLVRITDRNGGPSVLGDEPGHAVPDDGALRGDGEHHDRRHVLAWTRASTRSFPAQWWRVSARSGSSARSRCSTAAPTALASTGPNTVFARQGIFVP